MNIGWGWASWKEEGTPFEMNSLASFHAWSERRRAPRNLTSSFAIRLATRPVISLTDVLKLDSDLHLKLEWDPRPLHSEMAMRSGRSGCGCDRARRNDQARGRGRRRLWCALREPGRRRSWRRLAPTTCRGPQPRRLSRRQPDRL